MTEDIELPLPSAPVSENDTQAWKECMLSALRNDDDRKRFSIYSGGHFSGREDSDEYLKEFVEWATAFCYWRGLSDPLTWRDKNGVLLSEGGGPDVAYSEPSQLMKEQKARIDSLMEQMRIRRWRNRGVIT